MNPNHNWYVILQRSGICVSCIAWIGLVVCISGWLGLLSTPALAGFELDDDSTITLPLSWIMAAIAFLIMGVVVPACVYLVKKFDRKLDEFKVTVGEFEGAVQRVDKHFTQLRLDIDGRLAAHREHVGDKYAQIVDLRDTERRAADQIARIDKEIVGLRAKI